jgi:hypothetical protein
LLAERLQASGSVVVASMEDAAFTPGWLRPSAASGLGGFAAHRVANGVDHQRVALFWPSWKNV